MSYTKETHYEPIQFVGRFHKLSERGDWNELRRLVVQVRNSPDPRGHELLKRHLTTGEGSNSWTPLMLACARSAPDDIVRLLVNTCPESVLVADRSGGLPIHFLCSWRNSVEGDINDFDEIEKDEILLLHVLNIFVQANPETLRRQNQWGQTPLHCMFNQDELPSIDAFQSLLGLTILNEDESAPNQRARWESGESQHDGGFNSIQSHVLKALATPDFNSHLPLHLAALKGASEDILRLLVSLYPEAALEATPAGDLPVHLIQYWAEKKADEEDHQNSLLETIGTLGPTLPSFGGSGRLAKNKVFQIVTVGQIQTLLEPMSSTFSPSLQLSFHDMEIETILGRNAQMDPISERDEEATTENSNSIKGSTDGAKSIRQSISPDTTTQTFSSAQPQQSIVERAIRLTGSKHFKLAIHIAAEHGVSMEVIADLCDQYPEGVGTAQLTPKVQAAPAQSDERKEKLEVRMQEFFPIELFENGRAGIEAEKAIRIQKRHVANPRNAALTNTTLASTGTNMSVIAENIKDFEKRSDLLFAYYPDATPSYFKDKMSSKTSGSKDVHRVRRRQLYRKDLTRLQRIESLIKSEAISANTVDFDTTAKLVWIWMIQQVNTEDANDKGFYQGCIGRIITGLPAAALKKLSFIANNGRKVHQRLTNQIGLQPLPFLIHGKSIQDYAKDRETSTTMEEMLKEKNTCRWQFILLEYLNHHDGLSFSLVCKNALANGICLLPEVPLSETGRTWNFPLFDETNDQDQTRFWQHIDFGLILPECTHTIIISYYLEISESQVLSFEQNQKNSQYPLENGGLMVVGEHSKENTEQNRYSDAIFTDKASWDFVARRQRKAIHSFISTPHGAEVHLSFKYDPKLSYSLRAHGPHNGGRVSVSKTKIRQVCGIH